MFVCTNVDFYAPKVLSFSSSLLCNNTCTCIYYACCICVMLLVVAVHNDTSIRLIHVLNFVAKFLDVVASFHILGSALCGQQSTFYCEFVMVQLIPHRLVYDRQLLLVFR